jgi:pyridoxamine 5'-phosphate oxidase
MVVATSSPDGIPSARVVLLREFDRDGFVFYTNYASRKGTEAVANPKASVVFFWDELDRQIRIEGDLEKIGSVESDRYFASRPRESQIAAWASNQSGVISGRDELQKKFEQFKSRFDGRPVPRPENWGGLRLRPRTFEFWQGRPNRLHDRIAYSLVKGTWQILRLAP